MFFEGYVVRVLSSFFSLRTVSSPALQRLVLSSLARADFPPLLYIFVLCGESRGRLSNDIIHPAHNTPSDVSRTC